MSNNKIIHWTIKITWEENTEEYISDIPNWVATNVDEYLNELEEHENWEENYNEQNQ